MSAPVETTPNHAFPRVFPPIMCFYICIRFRRLYAISDLTRSIYFWWAVLKEENDQTSVELIRHNSALMIPPSSFLCFYREK